MGKVKQLWYSMLHGDDISFIEADFEEQEQRLFKKANEEYRKVQKQQKQPKKGAKKSNG